MCRMLEVEELLVGGEAGQIVAETEGGKRNSTTETDEMREVYSLTEGVIEIGLIEIDENAIV